MTAGIRAVEDARGRAIGLAADVRRPDTVAEAFDAAEQRPGPVDILVNNAAGNHPAPAEELSDDGRRVVVVIVRDGTWICSAEFGRWAIAAERGGAILNIGATRVDRLSGSGTT